MNTRHIDHDIRNKLAEIDSILYRISTDITQNRSREIQDRVERLHQIVNSLKELQKNREFFAYGSEEPYEYEDLFINDLVQNAISIGGYRASGKQIEIRTRLQPDNGRTKIQASRFHFILALSNIIDNAIKYSSTFRSDVNVSRYVSVIGRLLDNGYEITVENIGLEISEAEQEFIFSHGYRGRQENAGYPEQFGELSDRGLVITHEIVENHNGKIRFTCSPLRDSSSDLFLTRFIIWFPLNQSDLSHHRERTYMDDANEVGFTDREPFDDEQVRQIDPNRTCVLYYPTITIPSEAWIKQAIFYKDEIGSIVPISSSGDEDLVKYSPAVKFLKDEGLFRVFRPESIFNQGYEKLEEFESEFRAIVESPHFSKILGSQRKKQINGVPQEILMHESKVNFSREYSFIHQNKVSFQLLD